MNFGKSGMDETVSIFHGIYYICNSWDILSIYFMGCIIFMKISHPHGLCAVYIVHHTCWGGNLNAVTQSLSMTNPEAENLLLHGFIKLFICMMANVILPLCCNVCSSHGPWLVTCCRFEWIGWLEYSLNKWIDKVNYRLIVKPNMMGNCSFV